MLGMVSFTYSMRHTVNNRGHKPLAISHTLSAFTLIELLTVVAIISLLVGLAAASFSGFNRRQTLDQAAGQLETDLQYARGEAIASVDGKHWGVHLISNSNSYETFSTSDLSYEGGESKSLPSGVQISGLSPEFNDQANVVFERLQGTAGVYDNDGDPLDPSTNITITLSLSGDERTVKVEAGGKIYTQE
jgi:prepilin-type N-terminal cleavage/methylation domain-containing protein